jgi:uncharacterized protein (UPF0333 family)
VIKIRKKSQAAMEFLMTYGWAIIVVLVAISALAYFGVLSPKTHKEHVHTATRVELHGFQGLCLID